MMKVNYILILLLCCSCLKKIEEVETANTNIFDEEYAGDQWFVFDDVYLYTTSNNDLRLKFEYSIHENRAPELQPTNIPISIRINGGDVIITSAPIQPDGNYDGEFEINPTGETNFCLEIGVYIEEENKTINSFVDCKDL